jgi:hypothetical protein
MANKIPTIPPIPFKSLIVLFFAIQLAGCAAHSVDIKKVQDAKNYQDLVDAIDRLDCLQVDGLKKCRYQDMVFNIFTLQRSEQLFHFTIDSRDRITDRQLIENLTTYHIFSRPQLPAGFDEFK